MTGSGPRDLGRSEAPDRAARALTEDLAALRAVTSRNLPPFEPIIPSTRAAREHARAGDPGGTLMKALGRSMARPWLVTALGTAAIALVLVFIPISYNRLIGSELTLHLGLTQIAPGTIRDLAGELRTKLGAEKVRVENDQASGLTMIAEIPDASWRRVGQLAVDYAAGLAGRGITATPRVRPHFEKVHGNVYAAIGNLVEIRIQTEGKSDSEIADEIKNQLLAAGLGDATVEVNRSDGQTRIQIEAQRMSDSTDAPPTDPPEFRISMDGHEVRDPDVQTDKAEVRIHRTEGMTDQDVVDEVKRQLEAQGVQNPDVRYEDGKLKIGHPGQ